MPHITIEHSINLSKNETTDLLLIINNAIAASEGDFDIKTCRGRCIYCPDSIIADHKSRQNFLHITIKILSGRSKEIRQKLAKNILETTHDFLKTIFSSNQTSLSIIIEEMDREIYQKIII